MATKAKVNPASVDVTAVVVTFWESGVGKSFRAFLYAAASALIAAAVAYLTNKQPATAVVLAPVVNWVLVEVKTFLDPNVQNLPSA